MTQRLQEALTNGERLCAMGGVSVGVGGGLGVALATGWLDNDPGQSFVAISCASSVLMGLTAFWTCKFVKNRAVGEDLER